MGLYGELADRLRRAIRNGQRLHLDYDQVVALLEAGVYELLLTKDAEELRAIAAERLKKVPPSPPPPAPADRRSPDVPPELEPYIDQAAVQSAKQMIEQARRSKKGRRSARDDDHNDQP